MLQHSSRLRSERDIKAVRSKGSVRSNSLFRLHYLRKTDKTPARAAIVVSLKVSKQAVTRNRLRRIARTVVRTWFDNKKPHMDVVISILPAAKNATPKQQRTALTDLLSKVE